MDPVVLVCVAVIAGLFAAAAVCIFAARRGPFLNEHPHCRRCRYDLVGRDPLPARCPECGTDLTPQRITRGLRTRRPALLWSGRILLLTTFAALGWFGYLASTGTAWIKHAPTPLLGWVIASSTDSARNDAIATELDRRWAAASTPPDLAALRSVAAAVIKARDNPKLNWDRTWESLIDRAFDTRATIPNLVYPDWTIINKNRADWIRAFDALVAG